MSEIKLNLTPTEAALLWNLVDAQSDAGACDGGNTPMETKTLRSLMDKLRRNHTKLTPGFKALRVQL